MLCGLCNYQKAEPGCDNNTAQLMWHQRCESGPQAAGTLRPHTQASSCTSPVSEPTIQAQGLLVNTPFPPTEMLCLSSFTLFYIVTPLFWSCGLEIKWYSNLSAQASVWYFMAKDTTG